MSKHTGAELKERREAAGILGYELGAAMGVHSTRVSQIEALAEVTYQTATRYLAALESLQLAKTTDDVSKAGRMTAERAVVRPYLTLIQGGRNQPEVIAVERRDWEEARFEIDARRFEELAMSAQLVPVVRRLRVMAKAAGPATYRDIAALSHLLERHARRWAEETDVAA